MSLLNGCRQLRWYSSRLRSMSLREVVYRFGERGKRVASRFQRPDFAQFLEDSEALPKIPGLAAGIQELADSSNVSETWQVVAEQVKAGRPVVLGQQWPAVSAAEKWHVDPVSGKIWPRDKHCFSIPYRHVSEYGDVKYVWDLNRLQHLQPIAALAVVSDREDLARVCIDELESWIEANRPFDGINWVSGIELALRVVSILLVVTVLGADAFSASQRQRILETLAAHAYWLMRYPSRFSSANNHLVAEASALYILGRLVPGLRSASSYADYGRRVLSREAFLQILEDGVGAEQSPAYAAFTLEWLSLCREIGRRTDDPFPKTYDRRLIAGGQFLRWITDSRGRQPRIGDDDEGRVLFGGEEGDGYVNSIMGCLAATLGRSELVPPATTEHLRHGFFGSPPAASPGPSGVRRFPSGGYTVLRWEGANTEGVWVFDHGPLGYLSIAAHGHADTLAVWLHLNGRPVIVDAGTYLYHSGGLWRDHFRGTGAHNTLMINSLDSSRISGPFNWSEKAVANVTSSSDDSERWYIEAEHSGYEKAFALRHRRRLERTAQGVFVLTDTLVGSGGDRHVSIGFLIHPDLQLDEIDTGWAIEVDAGTRCEIRHEGPLHGALHEGEVTPKCGWYSPRFGKKKPAARLVFSGRLSPQQTSRIVVTVLERFKF